MWEMVYLVASWGCVIEALKVLTRAGLAMAGRGISPVGWKGGSQFWTNGGRFCYWGWFCRAAKSAPCNKSAAAVFLPANAPPHRPGPVGHNCLGLFAIPVRPWCSLLASLWHFCSTETAPDAAAAPFVVNIVWVPILHVKGMFPIYMSMAHGKWENSFTRAPVS